jgi:hypothetical protein
VSLNAAKEAPSKYMRDKGARYDTGRAIQAGRGVGQSGKREPYR